MKWNDTIKFVKYVSKYWPSYNHPLGVLSEESLPDIFQISSQFWSILEALNLKFSFSRKHFVHLPQQSPYLGPSWFPTMANKVLGALKMFTKYLSNWIEVNLDLSCKERQLKNKIKGGTWKQCNEVLFVYLHFSWWSEKRSSHQLWNGEMRLEEKTLVGVWRSDQGRFLFILR